MANWSDPRTTYGAPAGRADARDVAFDAGLRSYMLSVYNYMASGVLLTGLVALLFAQSGMAAEMFIHGGILKWVVILAPLGLVILRCFCLKRLAENDATSIT